MIAGVRPVDHDVPGVQDLKPPRLGVVAAGSPARQFQDGLDHGQPATGGAERHVMGESYRHASEPIVRASEGE
jgi:hypothetical protein